MFRKKQRNVRQTAEYRGTQGGARAICRKRAFYVKILDSIFQKYLKILLKVTQVRHRFYRVIYGARLKTACSASVVVNLLVFLPKKDSEY